MGHKCQNWNEWIKLQIREKVWVIFSTCPIFNHHFSSDNGYDKTNNAQFIILYKMNYKVFGHGTCQSKSDSIKHSNLST